MTFDDDFVPRFLKAAAALPDDWDIFVLNWYCTTESAWREWCVEDAISNTEVPSPTLAPPTALPATSEHACVGRLCPARAWCR